MSKFTHGPQLEPVPGSDRDWRVTNRDFEYAVGELGSGVVVHVPMGTITDLASVPRPLWWLLSPYGRHTPAAVVHDALYRGTARVYLEGRLMALPGKEFADDVFFEAMRVLNTPRIRARLMYYAVKIFGRPSEMSYT